MALATWVKVLHLMDCASHPSNMHLVKVLQRPTQMEGFVWSSYMYMALQMYVIHVGDRCNSYGVYLFGYLLVVYVEGSRRAGNYRVHCSCQHLCGHLFNYRVVACGDLCKRFTCMVVHTYM